jgi:hypothetical protein
MITGRTPDRWEDLETHVAEILIKAGLDVESPRSIETVRGSVDVDVYAVQVVGERRLVILCECKHWRKAVPKTVVHSFRTVVQDSGAHQGYIISSAGFQKGAIEAAANSKVRPVTWQEFQAEFEADYYEHYFRQKLRADVDPILSFVEPISPGTFLASGRLPEENIQRFITLVEKYEAFGFVCLAAMQGMGSLWGGGRLRLPLSASLQGPDLPQLSDLKSYRQKVWKQAEGGDYLLG